MKDTLTPGGSLEPLAGSYDITEERERSHLFEELVSAMSGGLAIYKIVEGNAAAQYVSEGVATILGMTTDDYVSRYGGDIVSSIYEPDRAMVVKAVKSAMYDDRPTSLTYRSPHAGGGCVWVNGLFSRHITADGGVYLRAVFTPASQQFETQMKILDLTSTGVYIIDKGTYELYYCNETAFAMLGAAPHDYTGLTCHEALLGREAPCGHCSLFEALAAGRPAEAFAGEDGRAFSIVGRETDWNGKPAVIAYLTDITAKKTQEARVELEQKKPFANRKALVGYAISNLSKNLVVSHEELRQKSGEAYEGERFDECIRRFSVCVAGEETRAEFVARHDMRALLDFYERGGTTDTMEFQRAMPDGRVLWVRNTMDVLRSPATQDVYLYEYFYDIDRDKKTQLALDSLIDEEIDYVALVNALSGRGRLIRADESLMSNAAWQDYDHDTAMDSLISLRVHEADRDRCRAFMALPALRETLAGEKAVSIVYRYNGADGRMLRKSMRFFYLDGAREDIVVARRDVTDLYEEERRQKQELQRALDAANAASRAKSDFLARMSHEIRTPMNAIMGMTRLAADAAIDPQVRDYLDKISGASDYLLGILNDVLDMSRIENGRLTLQPRWVSASELVDDCLNMVRPMAGERGIRFVCPDTSRVGGFEYYVDPLRTKQIMMNLLNNAFKFTPAGGSVTLSARLVSRDAESCVEEISVSDTGCGMSEQFLERIFRPFEQEANPMSDAVQGTGLGLALVKSILTSMGGHVSVQSRLGEGSTFTVTLPHRYRLARGGDAHGREAGHRATDFTGRRVLLVDDHPLNREIAKNLLVKKGAAVDTAKNGREALDMFAASAPGLYGAVLMDIRMPVMDGLQAARAIRALPRPDALSTPIIAMTANAFDDDVRRSREAGMDAHLAKPVDVAKLYDTLDRLMEAGNG